MEKPIGKLIEIATFYGGTVAMVLLMGVIALYLGQVLLGMK
jgi:hypothetical protein